VPLALRKAYIVYTTIALVLAYIAYGLLDRYQAPRVVGLYWGRDTLERCIAEESVTQANGLQFAICRSWSEGGGEFVNAIVYDGSDRIGQGPTALPRGWETEIGACKVDAKTALFCRSKFSARPLLNHLFVVQFLHP
jgi:hypothetical protein